MSDAPPPPWTNPPGGATPPPGPPPVPPAGTVPTGPPPGYAPQPGAAPAPAAAPERKSGGRTLLVALVAGLIGLLVGGGIAYALASPRGDSATGACEDLVRTAELLMDAETRFQEAEVDSQEESAALDDEQTHFQELERDLKRCNLD